jgi:hypothetical protein
MQPLLYYFRFLFLGAFGLPLLSVGALLTDGATEIEGKLCGEREGRLDGMDDGDQLLGVEKGDGLTEGDELDGCDEVFPGSAS